MKPNPSRKFEIVRSDSPGRCDAASPIAFSEFVINPDWEPESRPTTRQPQSASSSIASLETMPHLVERLTALWNTRELNTFVHGIILDSRDGERQGLPVEAAEELLFVAKLNRLIRAQEAATLLEISLQEALDLIDRGDRAAASHASLADDPWEAVKHLRSRSVAPRNAGLSRTSSLRPTGSVLRSRPQGGHHPTFRLMEAPPLPEAVRIDVGTLRPLRSGTSPSPEGAHMDWGLFRCLAREACNLGIRHLEIADFSTRDAWPWLTAAVRFARQQCSFSQVAVYTDPLTTDIGVLAKVIDEGAQRIVVEFNMASGRWRTLALNILAYSPDFFRDTLARLIEYRDGAVAAGKPSCTIALARSGQHHSALLQHAFRDALALPGVVRYVPAHPGTASSGHAGTPAHLHCWAPFTMAHIRTNGHLVACAQDHSGYSFMADLKEEKLADAWSGHTFRKTRQRVLCGERPGRQCEICSHRTQGKGKSGTAAP